MFYNWSFMLRTARDMKMNNWRTYCSNKVGFVKDAQGVLAMLSRELHSLWCDMEWTYYCLISVCWICKSQLRITVSLIGPAVPFDGTGSRTPGGNITSRLVGSCAGSAFVTVAAVASRRVRNFIVRSRGEEARAGQGC